MTLPVFRKKTTIKIWLRVKIEMESNSTDSDSEDRSVLEKLLLAWSQLSTPVNESEIVQGFPNTSKVWGRGGQRFS